ncbi:MAG TPA: glycosyltransferase family 4 protein [Edaphocola sp.]|nr:glycosyltransferase family 4 protein [Edaphocola sp.]
MKRILYLTFYFEPDLSAGSFRNTSLVRELARQAQGKAVIDVFTTMPNRYSTFEAEASARENHGNCTVRRIAVPLHHNGMTDQVLAYRTYYSKVRQLAGKRKYDLVVVSSSRFFSAYLGYSIAKKQGIPLYLDIRDIFYDTMKEVLKNKLIKISVLPFLKQIERKVFNYAAHINLISGGFKSYFQEYSKACYSNFPNGIDDVFLDLPSSGQNHNAKRTIMYAGNIGEGQGLHKIIPGAAKALGPGFSFIIIGDGGAKQKLLEAIRQKGVTNVSILPPVPRKELLEKYQMADFLMIHLNDYEAFKKVLPSKVFELGAFDKPIIAGVAGFAHQFIKNNITNRILFMPGDVREMVSLLKNYTYKNEKRTAFIEQFNRSNINREMAQSMLKYLGGRIDIH